LGLWNECTAAELVSLHVVALAFQELSRAQVLILRAKEALPSFKSLFHSRKQTRKDFDSSVAEARRGEEDQSKQEAAKRLPNPTLT